MPSSKSQHRHFLPVEELDFGNLRHRASTRHHRDRTTAYLKPESIVTQGRNTCGWVATYGTLVLGTTYLFLLLSRRDERFVTILCTEIEYVIVVLNLFFCSILFNVL